MSPEAPACEELGENVAVRLRDVEKVYYIYERPQDRLKQMLWPGRRNFYRRFHALSGVDLEVYRGETVGVVGRNGSGKSTLLKLICGVLQPTSGSLEVHGHVAPLLAIGAGFNPDFTGRENVFLNATILGLKRHEIEERLDRIIRFADIGQFFDQPVKSYSSGMYSRLAFGVAIHSDPDILIVDEVLAVGDEAFSRKCYARIEEIKSRGATILLASHSASTVIELCDRAVLIERGERLLTGDAKTVVSRYQKMLYAPRASVGKVLDEIRALDRAGHGFASMTAVGGEGEVQATEAEEAEEFGYLDPALVSQSTVEYLHQGARIEDLRILDPSGRRVNVLRDRYTYTWAYTVEFLEPAFRVRFGMMLRLVSGFEIGGQVSHPAGQGIELVDKGERSEVRFQFRPALVPGTYFLNAGVRSMKDGEEQFLHRIVDAAVFRIDAEKRGRITGHVDLSDGQPATVAGELGSGNSTSVAKN